MGESLGVVPVPLLIKGAAAVYSILSGKKAKKKAEQNAERDRNAQAIAAGEALSALTVMTDIDKDILRRNWSRLRVVNNFALINWATVGALSAPAKVALASVWSQVRQAANFDDVNWNYHAVPLDKVAAVMPLPELGYQTPSVQNALRSASLLPGGIDANVAVIAGALALVGLIIFQGRR